MTNIPKDVYKIQRPISPSDAPYLIYNKSRNVTEFIEAGNASEDFKNSLFAGGELKAYAILSSTDDGLIKVDEVLPAKDKRTKF